MSSDVGVVINIFVFKSRNQGAEGRNGIALPHGMPALCQAGSQLFQRVQLGSQKNQQRKAKGTLWEVREGLVCGLGRSLS